MSNVAAVRNSTVEPLLLNGKLYMFEQLPRSIRRLTTMSLEPHRALIPVESSGMKMTRQLGLEALELLDSRVSVKGLSFSPSLFARRVSSSFGGNYKENGQKEALHEMGAICDLFLYAKFFFFLIAFLSLSCFKYIVCLGILWHFDHGRKPFYALVGLDVVSRIESNVWVNCPLGTVFLMCFSHHTSNDS